MNHEELARGKDCQSAALRAFNLDDLHTAWPLYAEAEAHYRAAYRNPRDRVFFMQASAVRCLEALIAQLPSLAELYRREAHRYLTEWTNEIIKVRVSPPRINEALAFRLWIKSNLEVMGSNIFHHAHLAAEAGDFGTAKELFDKAITKLTDSPDPERDTMVAIAKSKREMLVAREEILKRRANRDLRKIAWACLRAAKVSHLPAETTSTQTEVLSSRRYLTLSNALKWRAVHRLKQQEPSNDARLKSLEDAERFLRRAANYARTALSKGRGDELPATHASLLSYSHLTVLEGLALMRFMITGDDQHFSTAMEAWAGSLAIAKQLSETEKVSLFPHHFYSLKDLRLEELFLKAARAFRNGQWPDCVIFLQDWTKSFPVEYRWSWRYSNVRVRLLGASVIANICSGSGQLDRAALHQQIRDLSFFARTEPIGKAGRYFVNEVLQLQAKSADVRNVILQHLYPYFPLDSSVDSYESPTDIDPFDSLPKRVAWGLSLPSSITGPGLKQAKEDFLASVEAILGYICDYDAQWSCPDKALPEADIIAFLEFCRQFPWAKDSRGERLLNQLDALIQNIQGVTVPNEFVTFYEQVRQVLRRLLNFVPLVVSIESTADQTVQQEYVIASPEWCIDRPERESIRISVKSEATLLIKPGQYYLPPPWRTGNRVFYLVDPDDKYPLLPVRFRPRWVLPTWVDEKLSRQLPGLRVKGEGPHLEYKRAFPDQAHELAKEIAAFASSGGGLILIGVDDNGALIGIAQGDDSEKRKELMERVEGVVGNVTPAVTPDIEFAWESGKVVLGIIVSRGNKPIYYYSGRPYIRHLTQSRPATADEVAERHQARLHSGS